MNKKQILLLSLFGLSAMLLVIVSCRKDPKILEYSPTPISVQLPAGVNPFVSPSDNPLTAEGVKLGRMLFYDPILSGNNGMSCASCHSQKFGFTDQGHQFSMGIDSIFGDRNSMPIFNLGWERAMFWDGGSHNLETQVLGPLSSPFEMHETMANAVKELKADPKYPNLFFAAFGSDSITSSMLMKAIAQFERTVVSFNSYFDRTYPADKQFPDPKSRGIIALNPKNTIERGYRIFSKENLPNSGHCWHCHGADPRTNFFTDFEYHFNGLSFNGLDSGRQRITRLERDKGFFKTPTLRNLAFTAPYMHDGRFKTLDEVIEHYDHGAMLWNTNDGLANFDLAKPMNFSFQDKADLKAFLLSLSDSSLLTNNTLSNPL